MNKIIKILGIIAIIILTSYITSNIVKKEMVIKYNKLFLTQYANNIYAHAIGKNNLMLSMAAHGIGYHIELINKGSSIDMESYNYLCGLLKNSFKEIILDNYDKSEQEYIKHIKYFQEQNATMDYEKSRKDFNMGYKKLEDYCKKNNTETGCKVVY